MTRELASLLLVAAPALGCTAPAPRPADAAPGAAASRPPSRPDAALDDPARLESRSRPGARTVPLEELFRSVSLEGAWASPDGKRVVYSGNASGRYNLWIADVESGAARPLTRSEQRQTKPAFSPDGAWIAFQSDTDGDEQWDLFIVRPDGTELTHLTATPDVAESGARFSPDGKTIACMVRPRTSPSSEIALLDVQSRHLRPVTTGTRAGLSNIAPVFSRDGKRLAYTESDGARKNSNVYVVDLATGARKLVTPHEGERSYLAVDFSPDGAKLLLGSNARNGRDGVAVLDLATNALDWIVSDEWSNQPGAFSPDGRFVTFSHNADGNADLAIVDRSTGAVRTLPAGKGFNEVLPAPSAFSPDGSQLFFFHEGPDGPRGVWVHAFATGASRRVTRALSESIDPADLVHPELVHYRSSDGRLTISAFVYVPYNLPRDGRSAAITYVHGGPTSQFANKWNPGIQHLVHQGYVVIAPNFRGSTGYGDEFAFANRFDWGGGDLDDVRDAAAWVARTGFVDPKRLVIMGGSYGGYMALMGVAKQPETWAAAVSIVPFVNLFTEFATEDPELREYDRFMMGDPEKNRALWLDRSPIHFVDRIRAPVLLLAGGKDPSDPPTEAIQMAEAIRKRGGVAELTIYPDEGHMFSKTETRIDAQRRIAGFLQTHVQEGAPPR
ncbi:S9 family peptidase [Sorangium sp. So ce887]|uniref:S9 family peptidase n=1 Tax=Sorangium sp. So ce887 TaxID=3133324 RepID=UPI003F60F190